MSLAGASHIYTPNTIFLMPRVEFLLKTESHASSTEHAHIIMTAPLLAWIKMKLLQK